MASHSVTLPELIVAARTPARSAAATWLRISASSGDTMTVAPRPLSRSSLAAMKYTADLPQPVRCTTRACRRCTTRASIAVHWSSRKFAADPASCSRIACARARVAIGGLVVVIRPSCTAAPTWLVGVGVGGLVDALHARHRHRRDEVRRCIRRSGYDGALHL